MSDIFNNNRNLIDFIITGEDYWDFHLSDDIGYFNGSESSDCLSAYIDFNDPNCVMFDDVFSKEDKVWEYAVNEGVDLNYIGVTGVDNGFISYEKDKITNKEFLELFLHSTFNTELNDKRLRLRKVNGNNQIYDYTNNLVQIDNREACELNGGFYQGFFKIHGQNYQVLPYQMENGWCMEVTLKKSDLKNEKTTINDAHPNNKGMFLYIGTRAENKWWEKYTVTEEFDKTANEYTSDEYFSDGYTSDDSDVNSRYITEEEDEVYLETVYGEYCKNKNHYVDDEYIEGEEEITGKEELLTSDGYDFNQPNIIEHKTDNKFLFFNRTKDGFTTRDWDEDSDVTIYEVKKPDIGNYFTLFNRTPSGYDVNSIEKLIEEKSHQYDILKDLYRNALGFQIKDDGSIGFKYLVKDCNSETDEYKIEEMFSNSGVINNDEWYTVSILITPTSNHNIENPTCELGNTSADDEMVISIYVNGKLRLKSKNLPILNLKALNDLSDKQQGVPYSLSLGGGTQGLCDTININYRELPKYILPLEKEFCGSFIGYIQKFRFFTCQINFAEIRQNYENDLEI